MKKILSATTIVLVSTIYSNLPVKAQVDCGTFSTTPHPVTSLGNKTLTITANVKGCGYKESGNSFFVEVKCGAGYDKEKAKTNSKPAPYASMTFRTSNNSFK